MEVKKLVCLSLHRYNSDNTSEKTTEYITMRKYKIKNIFEDIKEMTKQKMIDMKQLKSEGEKLIKECTKLEKTALYGKIVNINKYKTNDFGEKVLISSYPQFVAKSVNGKQKKVYIGQSLEKLAEYEQYLVDGQELEEKLYRLGEIEAELISFYDRINPRYW